MSEFTKQLEAVVAQRNDALARARKLELAILHAIETSERLHPTAECCVEWQQEIETLRAAVQGPGQVVAKQCDELLVLLKAVVAEYDANMAAMVADGALVDGNPLVERCRGAIARVKGGEA